MTESGKAIFVAGGTGRHGGTGAFVARGLLAAGSPVRALARSRDSRAAALQELGAEVITGDLHDRRTLIPALQGIETAFFTYPIAGGIVDAAANFASAARAAGVTRIVVMSMAPAHPGSPSPLGRAQWLAEEIFEWSGLAFIHLRIAALFFENLELLHRGDILGEGIIRNSFPDLPLNWIAGADAAKIAVAALLFPDRFGTNAAVYPSGSEKYTHNEVAATIGRHLGRSLRHETISAEAWQERLLELSRVDQRISSDMAKHISSVGASMRQPLPVNDLFEAMTREKPVTLQAALETGYLTFQGGPGHGE